MGSLSSRHWIRCSEKGSRVIDGLSQSAQGVVTNPGGRGEVEVLQVL